MRDRHEKIVITKHETPVAKLVSYDEDPAGLVGFMRGRVLWFGDLIAPIDMEWDALGDEERAHSPY